MSEKSTLVEIKAAKGRPMLTWVGKQPPHPLPHRRQPPHRLPHRHRIRPIPHRSPPSATAPLPRPRRDGAQRPARPPSLRGAGAPRSKSIPPHSTAVKPSAAERHAGRGHNHVDGGRTTDDGRPIPGTRNREPETKTPKPGPRPPRPRITRMARMKKGRRPLK